MQKFFVSSKNTTNFSLVIFKLTYTLSTLTVVPARSSQIKSLIKFIKLFWQLFFPFSVITLKLIKLYFWNGE